MAITVVKYFNTNWWFPVESSHWMLAISSTSYSFVSANLNVVKNSMREHRMSEIYPSLMNNNLQKQGPRIVENITYNTGYILPLFPWTKTFKNNKCDNINFCNITSKLLDWELVCHQWKANIECWLFLQPISHFYVSIEYTKILKNPPEKYR